MRRRHHAASPAGSVASAVEQLALLTTGLQVTLATRALIFDWLALSVVDCSRLHLSAAIRYFFFDYWRRFEMQDE